MGEVEFHECVCRDCGNSIEYPSSMDGTSVACPHCSKKIVLSKSVEAAVEPLTSGRPGLDPRQELEELLRALDGPPLPKPRVSVMYQFGLLLTTVLMVLLPLIYMSFVCLIGWCTYYYATHFYWLVASFGSPKVYLFKLVVYAGPVIVGSVITFFMVKPLLARRAPPPQSLAVSPEVERVLFGFIHRVCRLVGAPRPKRVDLDCGLNAAAGYRGGVMSMLRSDMVLAVGLPLVAGLSVAEFAGVLAHEMGHFSQGMAMRLSYIIRSVNLWFARVAYERDAWDVALDDWAEGEEDMRVKFVLVCAQVGVWGCRSLLKLLMFVGCGASSFLMRQMEYDADDREIKLVGSATFEGTVQRLRVLLKAVETAYKDMKGEWTTERRMPESFPHYMLQKDSQMPAERRKTIEDTIGLTPTGFFDTHPCDADRIRMARRAAEPGRLRCGMPAFTLFANFDILSKQISMLHYSEDLGVPVDHSELSPAEGAEQSTDAA